jgi:type IV fimbrial biogenesis protein FimT
MHCLSPNTHRSLRRELPRLRRAIAGLTMIELVVTMSIAAILLTIAAPGYRYVTTSNRMSAEVNGLLGDLQYARAEAIREGQTVTVCVSNDGASCSGATAWNQGWIVFSDVNGDGAVEAGDTVLRVQQPFAGSDTFSANNNLSALTFNREGFGFATLGTTVTLKDSTGNNAYTRCLLVTGNTAVVAAFATSLYAAGVCQ